MELTGKYFVGSELSGGTGETMQAVNPGTGALLDPKFFVTTGNDFNRAVELAEGAFVAYRKKSAAERADFLESIAEEIEALGDTLWQRVMAETSLPGPRVKGETARTAGQLRLFARVLRDGAWADPRIDLGAPDRQPLPKPDLRRILAPLGPVGVFCASNFPLAFSVSGGDTASALAAGCPVIVMVHPSHLGTSELIGGAISRAVKRCGMPAGVFSLLNGSLEMNQQLVGHPSIKAIGFTGSYAGGRTFFDIAMKRKEPIPVYAEMGSVNPLVILPGQMAESHGSLAKGLACSATMGCGQFCTKPGVVLCIEDSNTNYFIDVLSAEIANVPSGTLLTSKIARSYREMSGILMAKEGVETLVSGGVSEDSYEGAPALAVTTGAQFISDAELQEEVFGPFCLIVKCESEGELKQAVALLDGQLTATLYGNEQDPVADFADLLQEKAGRLLFGGFPTGVEVCDSMQHGGPWPASSDIRSTSVGTAAIARFARPISFQNAPQAALPAELKNENPLGIVRMVDGNYTADPVQG